MVKLSATTGMSGDFRSLPTRMLRASFVVPFVIFLVLAVFFGIGLTMNPSILPSVLIGKTVPEFDLPPVQGRSLGLSDKDLKNGEVSLLNVFASWCAECRVEHPIFMDLAARDVVPIHGLNFMDKPADAENWLDTLGDPYTRTGVDPRGRVGIEFGVYGVPETFVIDGAGRIAYKHIGALNEQALKETILPLIEELRRSPPQPAAQGSAGQ
jgi:cytochrome c biogenesis protein CcmG/thiol:disulfide interchange protein DsbE